MIWLCGGGLFLLGILVLAFIMSARDSQELVWKPVAPNAIVQAAEQSYFFTDCQAELFGVPAGCVIVPVQETPEGHNAVLMDREGYTHYSFRMDAR